MKLNKEKYGKWALITGASSGIGKEYANEIARAGFNVIAVARNENNLNVLKSSLITQFKVDVRVIAADLTSEEDINRVIEITEDLEVGLLVNNAGREDSNHFFKNK